MSSRSLVVFACLAAAAPGLAPSLALGQDGEAPPVSSAALAAAAPELAAVPDMVLVGYRVSGRSPRAIRESMNEGRPAGDGDRFDGRTQFRYSTRWRTDSTGRCDPSTAEVTAAFIVTLPELASRDVLDRREREAWDRYFRALVIHEYNHVRIAQAGLEQLKTFMRNAPSCEAMAAAREQISAAVTEAQAAYDRDTGHGRTEGAVYPQ